MIRARSSVDRLLFVLPFPVLGAAEDYGLTIASGLGDRGWQVTVAHPAELALPDGRLAHIELTLLPSSIAGLTRWFASRKPTVVHVNQVFLPALGAARLARTHPLVATVHTPALSPQLSIRGRTLRAFAQPGVDRWIVLSDSNRKLLAHSRTTGDDAITVVHPGLPGDRFHQLPSRAVAVERLGIDPQSLIVGTISRLAAVKRHDVLIDAIARAATQVPALKLVIVGDGELSAATHRLAEECLPGQVVFTGHRTDAIQLLPGFDVFAMSSDFEGLPFALLEAMATGRAIVTTDVQGAGEAVRNEREGLLVPRRDPEALATAIVRLARDGALAKKLGEAARQRFLDEFTADRMVERTEALYLELLEQRGPR